MRTMTALTLVLAFSACGKESKDGRPSYDGLKAEIDTNHEQWRVAAPEAYSYKVEKNCFCDMTTYQITVAGGQISKVERFVYDADGKESKEEVSPDSDDDIRSIDELFALAEEWADRRPDELTVTFDPTHHFPERLAIDHSEKAADDETQVLVSEFLTQ